VRHARQVKGELLRAGISSPRGKDGASTTVAEIENILDQTGAAVRLKNLIYETYRQASAAPPAPPPGLTAQQVYVADKLDYVERAKLKWEKRIRQELDAMAAELGVPLQRKRKDEPIVKPPPEDQPIRFVYGKTHQFKVIPTLLPYLASETCVCASNGGYVGQERVSVRQS